MAASALSGEYETFSQEETMLLAQSLAEKCMPGDVFALSGDLGAGKTVFTKGFAKGLHIDDVVSSPTFTIMQIYEGGKLPLYHFDVYRIGDIDEMDEIGYEDYFYGDGVTIVEWADLIRDLLPDAAVNIRINTDLSKGCDYRKIKIG